MDHAAIIDELGAAEIATRLDIPQVNVRVWKNRRTIPRWAYAELMTAFPLVTLETLKNGEPGRASTNANDHPTERAA